LGHVAKEDSTHAEWDYFKLYSMHFRTILLLLFLSVCGEEHI